MKNIYGYSILAVEKRFIILGGRSWNRIRHDTLKQSTVARFDPIENIWTKLGDLKTARSEHGVIQVDNEFIVVGGSGKNPTESCKLNGQLVTCTKREPRELLNFAYYPELMLIP